MRHKRPQIRREHNCGVRIVSPDDGNGHALASGKVRNLVHETKTESLCPASRPSSEEVNAIANRADALIVR
jgi:hypothetical protein